MIRPDNPWKEKWDLLVVIITLYVVVEVPMRLAFPEFFQAGIFYSETIVTLVFSLDILLNFLTGYYEKGDLISDSRLISRKYFRRWFAVDLLSAIPFFIITGKIAMEAGHVFRFLHLFQLNRIIKITRFGIYLQTWQKEHLINPGLYRLLFFIIFISIASHWIACIWILMGGTEAVKGGILDRYSYALYWSITTLTTVGYGDITPKTVPQRFFTILVMIAGVGTYGYVIGNITSFIANLDRVKAGYKKRLEEVTSFLNYKSVSPELQKKVHEYYEHLWESQIGSDENRLLNDIPDPLRTDLALFMRKDLIRKVPFFQNADENLMRDLVMILRPRVFLPDTKIIEKDEMGTCMYIVSSGKVDILSDDEESVITTLGEGSFVGEMALVLERPRSATVKTVGYCDLYVLEKEDFDTVLVGYPEFALHIQKIVADRIKKRDEKGLT